MCVRAGGGKSGGPCNTCALQGVWCLWVGKCGTKECVSTHVCVWDICPFTFFCTHKQTHTGEHTDRMFIISNQFGVKSNPPLQIFGFNSTSHTRICSQSTQPSLPVYSVYRTFFFASSLFVFSPPTLPWCKTRQSTSGESSYSWLRGSRGVRIFQEWHKHFSSPLLRALEV